MVLESREMSSSNWTSLTPSCSMREVKTPYGNGRISATAMRLRTGASWAVVKTSSDSIVLHPPAEASSAMMFWKRQLGRREARSKKTFPIDRQRYASPQCGRWAGLSELENRINPCSLQVRQIVLPTTGGRDTSFRSPRCAGSPRGSRHQQAARVRAGRPANAHHAWLRAMKGRSTVT